MLYLPLTLIIGALTLCVLLSKYVIANEKNKTKRGLLNLTQLLIFISVWKLSSFLYVEKLGVVPNDFYIYIPILIIAIVTGLINLNKLAI